MSELEMIQHCINTGEGVHIYIPGKIDFEILHRYIPDHEGQKPPKPSLWRNAKQYVDRPTWLKVRNEMQETIDDWWIQKNKNVAERKTLRKLAKIKKMVLRLEVRK